MSSNDRLKCSFCGKITKYNPKEKEGGPHDGTEQQPEE